MEAAGIEGDQHSDSTRMANKAEYENNKIQAILDMIYTDEGQQQMVNWVKIGEFPTKLTEAGFESVGTYTDQTYRAVSLASLFPCSTGTFTSFANHTSRFGYTVLTKYESVKDQLSQWIIDGHKPSGKKNDIVEVGNDALDCKIARIIFILDIFDDIQQIKDVCSIVPEGYQAPSSRSEYTCRPVSAIIANKADKKLIAVELAPPLGSDDEKLMDAAHLLLKSGVDVRIITPNIPDKKNVKVLTNYNYGALLKNGACGIPPGCLLASFPP